MPVDHIRYDLLTQDALRGVIRTVLADAAAKGLPGDHHFFITFDTRAEGVEMSPRLKASYPQEMTIVLQHQFWDLAVTDQHFEVGLAFNGISERLHVPFHAIKAFLDPSVQFAAQFTVEPEAGETAEQPTAPDVPALDRRKPKPDVKRDAKAESAKTGPKPGPKPDQPAPDTAKKGEPSSEGTSGEVVRLDRFRKK